MSATGHTNAHGRATSELLGSGTSGLCEGSEVGPAVSGVRPAGPTLSWMSFAGQDFLGALGVPRLRASSRQCTALGHSPT